MKPLLFPNLNLYINFTYILKQKRGIQNFDWQTLYVPWFVWNERLEEIWKYWSHFFFPIWIIVKKSARNRDAKLSILRKKKKKINVPFKHIMQQFWFISDLTSSWQAFPRHMDGVKRVINQFPASNNIKVQWQRKVQRCTCQQQEVSVSALSIGTLQSS